jgi:hypothetical protein
VGAGLRFRFFALWVHVVCERLDEFGWVWRGLGTLSVLRLLESVNFCLILGFGALEAECTDRWFCSLGVFISRFCYLSLRFEPSGST